MHSQQSIDEAKAATWMRHLAEITDAGSLPDPQLLWWKAQALRRIDYERAASAAYAFVERLQILGSVAAALALLVFALSGKVGTTSSLLVPTIAGGIVAAVVGAIELCRPRDVRSR